MRLGIKVLNNHHQTLSPYLGGVWAVDTTLKASWDLKTIMWGITFLTVMACFVVDVYTCIQERMLPVLDGIAICSSVVARQFPTVPSPLLRRDKQM